MLGRFLIIVELLVVILLLIHIIELLSRIVR